MPPLAATRITLTGVNSVRLEKRLNEESCPHSDRFGQWRAEALAADLRA